MAVWTQGDRNIWIHDLGRRTLGRVTFEGRNARVIWTPDGKRVTYGSATAGDESLFWKLADGSGSAERLVSGPNLHVAGSWSPDGRILAFVATRGGINTGDIMTLRVDGDRRPQPFLQSRFSEAYPEFSSDGWWLAYASDESGRSEVYVQPFPGPGPRQQVSTDGGTAPAWSRDGRELFYTTAQTTGGQAAVSAMMAVPVTIGSTFTAGTPRVLFQGRYGATALIRGYDVTADGKRFLMVQQKERPVLAANEIVLVENWIQELRRRAPSPTR